MKIIRKKFTEVDNKEILEIDELIENNFGLIFHETQFNRIVSESFNTELSYFVAYNNDNKIIGICPLHTIKKGLIKLTYSNPAIFEVPYGGWIFDNSEISISDLIKQMKIGFNESLIYWSNIQIEDDKYKNLQTKKTELQTPIIDLSYTTDEILHRYVSKKQRQDIRRASRKGVSIEKLDLENFEVFKKLSKTLKNTIGLKAKPEIFYDKLYRCYFDKNKISAFAAKFEGKYISTYLNIGNRHIVHVWIAGRIVNLPKSLCQNQLLMWESIKWAKKNGSKYFDLCVLEQKRLPHIARFKLGFSKNIVPFYHLTKKPMSFRILSRIQRCFIR